MDISKLDSIIKEELANVIAEGKLNEKFVKDFDKKVLKAQTEREILKVYPKARFFVGKMTHFFGELEPNLFFKAYYQDWVDKKIKEFHIVAIYSKKGSNYVYLYDDYSNVKDN